MRRSSRLKAPPKTLAAAPISTTTPQPPLTVPQTPLTVAKKGKKASTSKDAKRRLSTTNVVEHPVLQRTKTTRPSNYKKKKSKRKHGDVEDDYDNVDLLCNDLDVVKDEPIGIGPNIGAPPKYTGNWQEDCLLHHLYQEHYADQTILANANDRGEKTRHIIESKAAFYKNALLSGKVTYLSNKVEDIPPSIQAKIDHMVETFSEMEAEKEKKTEEPQRKSKRSVSFAKEKQNSKDKKKDINVEVGRPWMVDRSDALDMKCAGYLELEDHGLSSTCRRLDFKMHLNTDQNKTIMQSSRTDFYSQSQPVLRVHQSDEDLYRSQFGKKEQLNRNDNTIVSCGQLFRFLYEHESNTRIYPYMSRQNQVNSKMRSILVDWLGEVHYKFKFASETLWLTISILDRYLEKIVVTRAKLQLVGVTALFIACKYEETSVPNVGECVYITDNAYDVSDVLDMELKILEELHFSIYVPTAYTFLCRYLDVIKASKMLRNLTMYYSERNLQEYDSLLSQPHMFAAAALYAALVQRSQYSDVSDCHQKCLWPQVLVLESGLTEGEIMSTARTIIGHIMEEPETASKRRLNAIRKKYTSEKFMGVAHLSIPGI
jgi:G2/mitotic-specific cyclin-B, other